MHDNPVMFYRIVLPILLLPTLCHMYDHCTCFTTIPTAAQQPVRRRKISSTDEEVERMEISGDSPF